MRIAACADLHLDRIPSFMDGFDQASGHYAIDELTEYLINNNYDVLLLCGDVMDREESWYSCYGPLVSNLSRLKKAGINVIGVAGNHDANVFSQIAKSDSDKLTILGRHGEWEYEDYNGIRFVGWSFSDSWEKSDPMKSYPVKFGETSMPVIGLLHCDVNDSPVSSKYAGVLTRELEESNVKIWMLGHIHAPNSNGKIHYCGSPYPLDRSETGFHGMWSFEVVDGVVSCPEFIHLSSTVYYSCNVDITGVKDEEEFQSRILKSCQETADRISSEAKIPLKRLIFELVLSGDLASELDMEALLHSGDGILNYSFEKDEVSISISNVKDETQLALNLNDLARKPGPIGALARTLLCPSQEVLDKMIMKLGQMKTIQAFSSMSYCTEDAEKYLKAAGKKLLHQMLEQEAKR